MSMKYFIYTKITDYERIWYMIEDDIGLYVRYFHKPKEDYFTTVDRSEEDRKYLDKAHYTTDVHLVEVTKEEWEREVFLLAI